LVECLEAKIAAFHHARAGLIFNSGYDANIGLFSSVPRKGDTILYDELIHASIRDGVRLSLASHFSFKHNNINQLEEKIKIAKGNVFVAVESVYSMDGDFAPLKEISDLCSRFGAFLIVDEAHATGIFGKKGEGRVSELGLEENVFARMHTFGKALGCHGGIVLGSDLLRDYLINFARSFIYTTALPVHSLIAINCAYDILTNSYDKILKTRCLIDLFKAKFSEHKKFELIQSISPIQCILIPGNVQVKMTSEHIKNAGYDVRPILSPTVFKGQERLRICLHAFNSEKEIEALINELNSVCT
jgi:8-amino-7-oxononanoate synthase